MKPQLAAKIGPRFNQYPCFVQPKLDGVRCMSQIHGGAAIFMSRDQKLWHVNKLRHLQSQVEALKPIIGDRILDGELYKHGWKLQRINGSVSVNSVNPRDDTHEVEYHIFDTIEPTLKFSDRWLELSTDLIGAIRHLQLPNIHVVRTSYVQNKTEMEQHFQRETGEGYEGLMLRPDGPYVYGETEHGTRKNSPYLWKYKNWVDDEFTCVGVTHGIGKASIGIGALILDNNNGGTFKVGTGFDDETRIDLHLNPPLGKLVRVKYLFLTDDHNPFNPSFIAVMN